ncbi:aminotransferase class III-fold pyridoxal phosphate-dependent enzyme [Paenochrobactrum gallinarii]|uniref:aminotransferase class III-fold pyridoxal phosphate-dependent enzyme n=1 Tax=Paenochrobactrum gallinarii TaxID=643673 RepID=UPI001AED44FF
MHTKVCSGSTAMEGAIKYAMFNTGRREIITFRRSHHGQTFYTMNMSGFSFRSESFPVAKQALHCVSYPADRVYPDDSGIDDHLVVMNDIKNVLRFNSQNQIAAIVIEPILGNGGGFVCSRPFLHELRDFCTDNGICLIFDEIQTGIGWTCPALVESFRL